MIIVGILSAAVLPRFVGRQVFDMRGAFDEVAAALRFARQQAVAQRRQVCVAVTTSGVTITRAQAVPPAACVGTALANPADGAAYVLAMPNGVTIAGNGGTVLPTTISFDALGRPNAAAGLCVNGDGSFCLTVNAESGYVQH